MCAQQMSFSGIFLLNKIMAPKFITIHIPLTLASTEDLNQGIRSKLISRVNLPFDINVKEREAWEQGCIRSELDERKFG